MSVPLPSVDPEAHAVAPPREMTEALAMVQRIGGQELVQRIIVLFRTTSAQRVGALRAALADGDRQQVSRLAHAMKGSAAQVGAESLRAVSFALEREALSLPDEVLSAGVDVIEGEVVRAWSQLEACGRLAGIAS